MKTDFLKNKKLAIFVVLIVINILVWPWMLHRLSSKKGIKEAPSIGDVTVEEKRIAKEPSREEVYRPRSRTETEQWGRDPFSILGKGDILNSRGLTLTGISWEEKEALAIINGNVVKKGDMVYGLEVAEIKKDSVILRRQDKDYILLRLREE